MQTTLRLDDRLYREAKSAAAQQGITLTRFLEEAIRLRLRPQAPENFKYEFPIYAGGDSERVSANEIKRIADEEQEKHDLEKLGFDK